jgi:hypothetical protein
LSSAGSGDSVSSERESPFVFVGRFRI